MEQAIKIDTYKKKMNFDVRSPQGFPFCPECGGTLFWECDYMLSDLGYIQVTEGDELDPNDHAVNTLHCPHCEKYFEVEQTDEGERLLCVMDAKDDDDDEVRTIYTDYAIDKFHKDYGGNQGV